jgi:hypothetical protein
MYVGINRHMHCTVPPINDNLGSRCLGKGMHETGKMNTWIHSKYYWYYMYFSEYDGHGD